MYADIQEALLRFGNFTEEQLSEIFSRLKFLTIPKGGYLIREGKVCREFHFIQKGCFRQYTVLETGAEATINLWVEKDWVFDYRSFIRSNPPHPLHRP